MMKADEMLLDFINQLFIIALGIFVFVFVILGDRLGAIYQIMESLSPFGFFGLFFVIKLKLSRLEIRKRKNDGKLDEVLFYLSPRDAYLDNLAISSIAIILVLLPIFFGKINSLDLVQAMLFLFAMLFVHKIFFKKGTGASEEQFLTKFDEIIDELIVFILPLFIYVFPFLAGAANRVDILQIIAVFVLGYFWHFNFFKLKDR